MAKLEFDKVTTPVKPASGGPGREVQYHWEELVAPLKAIKLAEGESLRIKDFDIDGKPVKMTFAGNKDENGKLKNTATGRRQQMANRLWNTRPTEKWDFKALQIPTTDDFGIYARYGGERTEEEVKKETVRRETQAANRKAASSDAKKLAAAASSK